MKILNALLEVTSFQPTETELDQYGTVQNLLVDSSPLLPTAFGLLETYQLLFLWAEKYTLGLNNNTLINNTLLYIGTASDYKYSFINRDTDVQNLYLYFHTCKVFVGDDLKITF